jgi:hypothetical protein
MNQSPAEDNGMECSRDRKAGAHVSRQDPSTSVTSATLRKPAACRRPITLITAP